MRKTILLTAVTLLLSGMTAGVVGHNSSGGDMQIMSSGSSASASKSVGPNGTEWTAEVSQLETSCWSSDSSESISEVTYSGEDSQNGKKSVSFTGTVETANPCYTVDHEVEKQGENSYVLNVRTESESGPCTSCVGMLRYDASFQTDEEFELTVKHGGETVETVEHPGYSDTGKKGAVEGLFNWLSRLF